MLEVVNLSKKYGKFLAVNQVTFTIPKGQSCILLGPNGAGKSTIIKSIAGLVQYDGQIMIDGLPAKSIEAKKIFGYVPEIPTMFEALTVREHMEYVRRAYRIEVEDQAIDTLLERFELLDKQEKLGGELSKGMMQKVSICCALLIDPKVILFDEPMVGLDPSAIRELKTVIEELKQKGVTILISTHMMEMVKDLWDSMLIVDKGQIIAEYQKEEVEDKDMEALFFDVTGGE